MLFIMFIVFAQNPFNVVTFNSYLISNEKISTGKYFGAQGQKRSTVILESFVLNKPFVRK